jgi:hypothetical protein
MVNGIALYYYLAATDWHAADVPNPEPKAPEGLDNAVDVFLGWLKWGGIVGGVAMLLVCGIMMMVGRRNRSAIAVEGATGIGWVIAGLAVIVLAAGLVGAVLDAVG